MTLPSACCPAVTEDLQQSLLPSREGVAVPQAVRSDLVGGQGAPPTHPSAWIILPYDYEIHLPCKSARVDARNLKRLAARAWLGVARTGSSASNGSGDYTIAFSTAPQVRIHANDKALTRNVEVTTNDAMSPLFLAAIEATEEAVYISMFKAVAMTGNGHTVEALPIEKTMEILKKHRVIK